MSFAGLTTATQHQQPERRPRKRYTIDNNTETIRPNTRNRGYRAPQATTLPAESPSLSVITRRGLLTK